MNSSDYKSRNKVIMGIMGPGESATEQQCELAQEVGRILAKNNCIVLTGGRDIGVMEAALKGAKSVGGQTIGILPDISHDHTSEYVDIPIYTGMGQARNVINVLSSDCVISIGMSPGTLSEIALALKHLKPLLLCTRNEEAGKIFSSFEHQPDIIPLDSSLVLEWCINTLKKIG